MLHNPGKLREDILRSIQEIETFCQDKTFHDFQQDRALQLIIERESRSSGKHWPGCEGTIRT